MSRPSDYTDAEQVVKRATMTIAAAARALEISRDTLLKWHECKHIRLITIGPPGHEIRRVPASEVERLRVD